MSHNAFLVPNWVIWLSVTVAIMESDSSSANSSELLALEENNVPDIFVQSSENKQIFTELLELKRFDDGYQEWVEISRWIKYQEEVEPEGNRWSKPHISTPSLRGWLELRKGLNSGLVLVDCEAVDFASLCQLISDELINRQIVNNEIAEKLVELWQKKHRHLFEGPRKDEGKLSTVIKQLVVQKLESKVINLAKLWSLLVNQMEYSYCVTSFYCDKMRITCRLKNLRCKFPLCLMVEQEVVEDQ